MRPAGLRRHRTAEVEQRRGKLAQRLHESGALFGRADVHGRKNHDGPPPQFRGKRINVGHAPHHRKGVDCRGGGVELAPGTERVATVLECVEGRAQLDERTDRMCAELERRDDAEVATGAANRPEQIGCSVALAVRTWPSAVTISDREQVVDAQPILAAQVAVAAVQGQAGIPVVDTTPPGTARPKICVSRSRSPQVAPPAARRSPRDRRARLAWPRGRSPGRRRTWHCRRRCGRRRGPTAGGRGRGRSPPPRRRRRRPSSGRSWPAAGRSVRSVIAVPCHSRCAADSRRAPRTRLRKS